MTSPLPKEQSVTQQDVREPLDIAGIRARVEAAAYLFPLHGQLPASTHILFARITDNLSAALDRIEELEAQLIEARVKLSGRTFYCQNCEDSARQLASSVERLKEMEADSKRLDWLGSQHTCVVTILSEGRCLDHYLHGTDATIREAIDGLRASLGVREP